MGKRNRRKDAVGLVKRVFEWAMAAIKVSLAIASAPMLAYAAWLGYGELLRTPYLSVKTISIEGAERVAEADVLRLSGLHEGQNLLTVEPDKAATAIEAHPWIREARVARSLPDRINIEVKERRPIALALLDALYLVDEDGVVFKRYSPEDGFDGVVITGLKKTAPVAGEALADRGLVELIGFLAKREGFDISDVSEVRVEGGYGFSVYTLEHGVRLFLGRGSYARKLSAFERVVSMRNGALSGVRAMDLTAERGVVVKLENAPSAKGGDGKGGKKG